mgnify:FL=1
MRAGRQPSGGRPNPSRATRWSEANSSGGLIVPGSVGASAPAPAGRFHATKKGASAPIRVVCSMTWGSASADRSIIASTPLPRTPVPPARKGRDSRPPGAGQPALIYKLRALGPWHRSNGALRSTARPVPPGTSPELFGAWVGFHRRTTTSTPRGAGRRSPPGQGNRSSSEPWRPHPIGTGTWSSSEPRASIPPEQGRRSSSEPREPGSTGARQTELFGASRARFHPGQGNRTSSEERRPSLIWPDRKSAV